jgi:hypothetical protein
MPRTKPQSEKSKAALVQEIRANGTRLLNQMGEVAQFQTEVRTAALRLITAAKDHLDPAQAQLVANDLLEPIGALVAVALALNAYAANAPTPSQSFAEGAQVNGAPRRDPGAPAEGSLLARVREKFRQARNNSVSEFRSPTPQSRQSNRPRGQRVRGAESQPRVAAPHMDAARIPARATIPPSRDERTAT